MTPAQEIGLCMSVLNLTRDALENEVIPGPLAVPLIDHAIDSLVSVQHRVLALQAEADREA